jgi:hypothetical protein
MLTKFVRVTEVLRKGASIAYDRRLHTETRFFQQKLEI